MSYSRMGSYTHLTPLFSAPASRDQPASGSRFLIHPKCYSSSCFCYVIFEEKNGFISTKHTKIM